MLDKPVEEIVYADGKVAGVKSQGEFARSDCVIGDPSYFTDKVKKVRQVVRCICIMTHPISNTNDSLSCQIIIPQNQVGRNSDIYVSCVSFAHNVASKNYYIAMVSTNVETSNPHDEPKVGLDLLGPVKEKFFSVSDHFVPTDNGADNKVYVTTSYDATSHFETTCDDVVDIYNESLGNLLTSLL